MKTDGIHRYFQLVEERPDLFAPSEPIPLCLEEGAMRAFAQQTGRAMGVVYDNSPHWWVLADLCLGRNGPYSYGRVVYCDPRSNGCAALIRRSGTGEFGLLTVFRHGCRALSLEIPRGFRDKADRTAQENVRREVSEELGVSPEDCLVSSLGAVRADAGLSAGLVQVFLVELDRDAAIIPEREEGIRAFQWYSQQDLRRAIRTGQITDGFTLSAYALYAAQQENG